MSSCSWERATSVDKPTSFWRKGPLLEAPKRNALRQQFGERVRFDEPMGRHTSLQVGGPADAYVRPRDLSELHGLLTWCQQNGLPWRVLGKGFNTLVLDGGLRGITISLASWRAITLEGDLVVAQAGVTHSAFARFCVQHGRSGMEFAVGIPGTVGGWLRMNAGTREREMADATEWIECVGPAMDACTRIPAASLSWRYRALELDSRAVLLGAGFRTQRAPAEEIQSEMDALLAARKATQPVHARSFGSVFKNPPGDHAGRLIEAVGLKGARAGDAEISTIHANFIINMGRARASDVVALIERAREQVQRKTGIHLETEVRIEGDATWG